MKKIFKKNQIIITSLALLVAVAGYLNFSGEKWTMKFQDRDDMYVEEVFTDEISDEDIPGEAVLTSSQQTASILASAKINREQIRSRNKDTLMEIINNENIADAQKQQAIDEMIKITDIAEREAAAETLLKAKGFEEVIVNINGDTADVVVKMAELDEAQKAQVEDVMKRKTNVPPENIVITPIE